ncbi:MAG TPA: LysR family transcriptional regulator [Polyangiaceae bacterium]|nr:LysR family transcriptional regulator [Polyangiaceae bacterium]
MKDAPETSELMAFAKTVETKSLSRAAAELGVPRATISRRLARLEELLGVRLLRRSTRSLALTEEGKAFYARTRVALQAVAEAQASVQPMADRLRGDLRVSFPPIQDAAMFGLLVDFARRNPSVRLHAHFSSVHVDLRRGDYDVALRGIMESSPGLVQRTLLRVPLIAVASPEYLAEHGVPRRKQDLRQHRCLLGFARGEIPESYWPVLGGGKLRVEGCFFSNDLSLLCEAARQGLGIALLPRMFVDPLLSMGLLVHVLPSVIGAESRMALVYPEREFMAPQVRAFIDEIARRIPEELANGSLLPQQPRPPSRLGRKR